MKNENLLRQLQNSLPPIFAATELDRLTGNALRWNTIQNLRCANSNAIPEDCFLKGGPRKVLIVRDPFLKWWMKELNRLGE